MIETIQTRFVADDKLTAVFDRLIQRCAEYERAGRNAGGSMDRQLRQNQSSLQETNAVAKTLQQTIATVFSVRAAASFVRSVAQVRGEFQQIEVALRTMLRSREQADLLMEQIVDLAARTPYDLQGVAQGAKQLLAYGSNVREVTKEIEMLGNVAAGVSAPINDIIYLYGTLRTQGRAYMMDIRQFSGRGIPIYRELAQVLGVAESEVSDLVSAGKVGFPEIERAFQNMTREGGQFYNLMAEQSKTITGQISMVRDAISIMFNDIGQSTEGVILGALTGVRTLIENYETVAGVIGTVVAAYGSYKAAVLLLTAYQKAQIALNTAQRFLRLSRNINSATTAMRLFNLATKANPIGLVVSAIATAISIIIPFARGLSDATDATEGLTNALSSDNKRLDEHVEAIRRANAGTKERIDAINNFNNEYGEYLEKLLTEKSTTEEISNAYIKAKNALLEYNLAKAQENMTADAREDYEDIIADIDKQIGSIVNPLLQKGKVSAAAAGAFAAEIRRAMESGEDFTREFGSLNAVNRAIDKAFGKEGSDMVSTIKQSNLMSLLERFTYVRAAYDQASERAAEYVEGYRKSLKEKTPEPVAEITYAQAIEEAKSAWDAAKKQLQNIQNNKDKFTVTQYEEAKGREETTRKKYEDLTGRTVKETKKNAKKVVDALQDISEMELRARRAIEDRDLDMREIEIGKMDEGLERQVRENELNAEREILRIRREQEDRLLQLQEDEKRRFIASGGMEEAFKSSITELPQEWIDYYDALVEQVQRGLKNSNEQAVDTVIREFGTLAERVALLRKEWMRKIEAETDEGRKLEMTNRMNLEIGEMEIKFSDVYKSVFRDIGTMTKGAIAIAIEDAEGLLERLSQSNTDLMDSEFAQSLVERINALQESYMNYDTKGWGSGWETVLGYYRQSIQLEREIQKERDKSVKDEAKIASLQDQQLQSQENLRRSLSATGLGVLGDTLSQAADAMREIASLSGDGRIADMANAMEKTASVINATAQGAATGGWIGAIVGAATSLFSILTEAITNSIIAGKEYEMLLKRVEEGLDSLRDVDYEGIFGERSLKKVTDAFILARKALLQYENAFQNSSIYIDSHGKGNKDYSVSGLMSELRVYNKRNYSTLEELGVIRDGMIDIEKANELLSTKLINQRRNRSTRDQLVQAIEYQKAYEEAIAVVDEMLSDMFGQVATGLADALWEGISSGADAWTTFENVGAQVIEKLGKMMIEEMLITDVLDNYREAMRDAISQGDATKRSELLSSLVASMLEESYGMIDSVTEVVNTLLESARREGIDVVGGLSQVQSRGIAQASQDSVDELNGRATAIQSHTYSIMHGTQVLVENSNLVLSHLSAIESHTARLSAIEDSLGHIGNSISQILQRGLTVK